MKKLMVIFLLAAFFLIVCVATGKEDKKREEVKYSDAEKKYSSAYVYIVQGDFEKAKDLLESVISDSSTYLDAYLAIWKVYLKLEEVDKARDILTNGISLIPREFNASGKPEESLEARRKLTFALADFYSRIDEKEEADQLFKDIVNENPDDANGYLLYAGYLEKQGKLDEAIMNYEKAHQLDPNNKNIALMLGDAYFTADRYEEAIESYQQAREEALQNINELLKSMESYQTLDPEVLESHIYVLKRIADAYMNLKKYKDAIQEYEKILEIIPKHVSSRIEIGNAYTLLKKYDKAMEYYNQALELEPNNLTVYYSLINMELSRENLKGVERYLNKGFEIDSNDAILLALKGEYYYRLGTDLMKEQKWNPALDQFNRAISIWKETTEKAQVEEWKEYAREGIKRAENLIKEVKKVRW
jgi:tetratricopeptide (TPR) repeat protein